MPSNDKLLNYKENWEKYYPPMMPFYYVDIKEMEKIFEDQPFTAMPIAHMHICLGYFEAHEEFEKAAIISKAIAKLKKAQESDPAITSVDFEPDEDMLDQGMFDDDKFDSEEDENEEDDTTPWL